MFTFRSTILNLCVFELLKILPCDWEDIRYDVFEAETVIKEMLLCRYHLEIYFLGVFVEVILS